MPNTPEVGHLIADCWQELFQLHRSLAELKRTNAQRWEFLDKAYQAPQITSATCLARIDPETWRKRAEEARTLADITANAAAKRSLDEIAESYEALASFQENTKSVRRARKQ